MRKAFTLIELLVVIVIIGVLATITAITINTVRTKARDTKRIADVRQVRQALDMYKNDLEVYPNAITPGQALIGTNGTTYMNMVPNSPTPRTDNGCPDQNYTYLGGNSTYSFTYCLNNAPAFGYPAGVIAATPGDIYGLDGYTVLLLHANGSGASFVDSSSSSKAISPSGDATQSATQSKFGGKSAYFDGNGDYLSLADNDDWSAGSGDYTVDFWMKTSQAGNATHYICGQSNSDFSLNAWNFSQNQVSDNKLSVTFTDEVGSKRITSTTSTNDNAWHHIAAVIYNHQLKLYIDGINEATYSGTIGTVVNISSSLGIGRTGDYNSYIYGGNIDEFRISKGIARWTGNFTPPAREY